MKAGFRVTFLSDASRGVNLNSDDSNRAVSEMLAHGADSANLESLTNT
jgi:hypothetical protein